MAFLLWSVTMFLLLPSCLIGKEESPDGGSDARADFPMPKCVFDYGPASVTTTGRSDKYLNTKLFFEYDPNSKFLATQTNYDFVESEWALMETHTFTYNLRHLLKYHERTYSFGGVYRWTYLYDTFDVLEAIYIEEWNNPEDVWEYSGESTMTYDHHGRLEWETWNLDYGGSSEFYIYDTHDALIRIVSSCADCIASDTQDITYDSDSTIREIIEQEWSTDPNYEKTYAVETYDFDEDMRLLEKTRYQIEAVEWNNPARPYARMTNEFDSHGRLRKTTHERYAPETDEWIPDGTTEYSYSDAGSSCTFEMLDPSPARWWFFDYYGQGQFNR